MEEIIFSRPYAVLVILLDLTIKTMHEKQSSWTKCEPSTETNCSLNCAGKNQAYRRGDPAAQDLTSTRLWETLSSQGGLQGKAHKER
jgi:hypothetical protein